MKLCIYYKTTAKPWGGSNSFIINLKKYLENSGVATTANPDDDYDLMLINGAYEAPGKLINLSKIRNLQKFGYTSYLKKLLRFTSKRKLKTVLRLDGIRKVYAGIDTPMDAVQLELSNIADYVIFQSNFAYESFKKAGFGQNNFSIIHNGVNQNIFNFKNNYHWDGKEKLKLVSYSWSKNPSKGHKIISQFSLLQDVEVSFIGNWAENVPIENVKLYPPLSQTEIADILKTKHVFLFPSENESCPNVLLESLSSGLPAIYLNSGANNELAKNFGIAIDINNLQLSLNNIKEKYNFIREQIFKNINIYSIETAGNNYAKIFNKLMNNEQV